MAGDTTPPDAFRIAVALGQIRAAADTLGASLELTTVDDAAEPRLIVRAHWTERDPLSRARLSRVVETVGFRDEPLATTIERLARCVQRRAGT